MRGISKGISNGTWNGFQLFHRKYSYWEGLGVLWQSLSVPKQQHVLQRMASVWTRNDLSRCDLVDIFLIYNVLDLLWRTLGDVCTPHVSCIKLYCDPSTLFFSV